MKKDVAIFFIGSGQIAQFVSPLYRNYNIISFDPRVTSQPDVGLVDKTTYPIVYYFSAAQTRSMQDDQLNEIEQFNLQLPKKYFRVFHSHFGRGTWVHFNTCHIFRKKLVSRFTQVDPISRYAESKLMFLEWLYSQGSQWNVVDAVLFPTIDPDKKHNIVNKLFWSQTIWKNDCDTQRFSIGFAKDAAEVLFEKVSQGHFGRHFIDCGIRFTTDEVIDFCQQNQTVDIYRTDSLVPDAAHHPYEFVTPAPSSLGKLDFFARCYANGNI